MKKLTIHLIAVAAFAIASCTHSYKPITSSGKADSASAANRYRLNEIVVMYKRAPTAAEVNAITAYLAENGIQVDSVRKCSDCKEHVELWQGDNIHTMIHAEGVIAGTVSDRGKTVGEDDLAHYSVNFINSIPMDTTLRLDTIRFTGKVTEFSGEGKDTIRVAVLDTGIDAARVVSPTLQWRNAGETANEKDDDGNCYDDDIHGWNFIDNNSNVHDDNINLHGTLVSHYIINEFVYSPKNFVQIMSLKTHDKEGSGDLFSSICALHYAVKKRANIINASWGFYDYNKDHPHPYLEKFITATLRQKGILFVTAAGNKDEDMDEFAIKTYRDRYGVEIPATMLRNLEYHNFFPACLSRQGKNVVTVTTTDGTLVSPTQNYSEKYVDVGVMRDVDDGGAMKFKMPFPGPIEFIGGSSFATAIACGKFGAYFPRSRYLPELNKVDVFEQLRTATPPAGRPALITLEPIMERRLIRDGKKTYPK